MTGTDDASLDALVDAFLEDDHAAIDPALPGLMRMMAERRAGRSWHKHGSFKDHLFGTYRILTLWGQPPEVRLCGLLHSVYSNEYVNLALFDPAHGRAVLRGAMGGPVEEMIHLFCTMPRNRFIEELVDAPNSPVDGMTLVDDKGASWFLSPQQVAGFLAITVADLVEQWYSWQEDTMSGYPHTVAADTRTHWQASLWPGAFRPGSSALSLASRLARHLPKLPTRVPPVFDGCTRTLVASDEAAAAALYWQVVGAQGPLVSPSAARGLLETAVRLNPFVAEPRLQLAQIDLVQGDFDGAARHARAADALLRAWGVQWDKRVSWQGWVIWARLLAQSAADRSWPATLPKHNNLGLIRP